MSTRNERRLTHRAESAEDKLHDTETELACAMLDLKRIEGTLACTQTELRETQLQLVALLDAQRRMMTPGAN